MTSRKFFTALATLLFVASSLLGEATKAAVRTPDQRRIAPFLTYPWSLMGRIEFKVRDKKGKLANIPARHLCTATIVGSDLALTSGTCLVDRPLAEATYVFIPFLNTSVKVKEAFISAGSREADFAIVRLERPVAGGYRLLSPFAANHTTLRGLPLMAGAYSRDKLGGDFPAFDPSCQVTSANSVFQTSCSVEPNSSGGPLLFFNDDGTAYLVGMKLPDLESATDFLPAAAFNAAIEAALAGRLKMTPYR